MILLKFLEKPKSEIAISCLMSNLDFFTAGRTTISIWFWKACEISKFQISRKTSTKSHKQWRKRLNLYVNKWKYEHRIFSEFSAFHELFSTLLRKCLQFFSDVNCQLHPYMFMHPIFSVCCFCNFADVGCWILNFPANKQQRVNN